MAVGKTQKFGDGKHLENTCFGCDDGCNRSDGDGAGDLQPRQQQEESGDGDGSRQGFADARCLLLASAQRLPPVGFKPQQALLPHSCRRKPLQAGR